jgi:hypothetical protein
MALPAHGLVLGLLVLASPALSVPSAAPQTPPNYGALGPAEAPPESWEGVSRRLAISLVDAEARLHEEPLFLPKSEVRQFGRTDSRLPEELGKHFDGWRVVGVQSFEYPLGSIAVETGRLFQRAHLLDPETVPELLVRAMTPPADQVSAAEQAATRWVTAALKPERGDKLAMIVLWDPDEPNRPIFERLTFVLVKAGRLPDGRYRVQTVCYGSAQQAVLAGA